MASRLYWNMRGENDREIREELLIKRNGQGQRLSWQKWLSYIGIFLEEGKWKFQTQMERFRVGGRMKSAGKSQRY